MYFGSEPYGLEGHLEHKGDGSNLFRGEDFAQPRALRHGDKLANGYVVVGRPFDKGNGSVGLNFTNGSQRFVPGRIPLQLRSARAEGVLPQHLKIGHILQTGDVILADPRHIGQVEWHNYQDETEIRLTGGWYGHEVGTPSDLPLAVFEEVYPPSTSTQLGAFALREALGMKNIARINLPQLGQLALDS